MDQRASGGVGEQPLAELAHCPAFDLLVHCLLHGILNDPRDFVLLVRNGRMLAQHPQRHFGQNEPGSDALGGGLGGHLCQPVARLFLIRLAH